MADKILDIRNLDITFSTTAGPVHAIRGVNMDLERGETVAIVGESGSGKSVVMKTVMGILAGNAVINSGEIIFRYKEDDGSTQEVDILKKDKKWIRRNINGRKISMIFQDPMTALNPVLTVGEQIAETIKLHTPGISEADAMKRAGEMLETVGIQASRAGEYPHQFSGGMKQRVIIAIGLACNPKLLIADEPTTALDVTIQAQILEIMGELKKKYRMSMIMITHDLGIVAEVCDEVSIMYAGKIVEHGTLEDVFDHTKHPYTEGLFDSLPNIDDRKAKLKPIPGLMPDPTNLPKGCAFAPRCPYATKACEEKEPEQRWISDTHMVACTAYDDPSFHIQRKEYGE